MSSKASLSLWPSCVLLLNSGAAYTATPRGIVWSRRTFFCFWTLLFWRILSKRNVPTLLLRPCAFPSGPTLVNWLLLRRGVVVRGDIASPPPVCLPPSGFCSTTVRLATAYATWLEAAADVLAQCVSLASAQPVSVTCEGLGPALGPARAWLTACGFTFHAHGMSS